MTDKKQKIKKIAKWFLLRLPIVFGIAVIIMIGALKLVERYPDPLREGFEEYLTNVSGANATITSLETITFFPNFSIRFSDLTMHNQSNAALIDVQVDKAYISAPFWSILTGGNRLIDLNVEGLQAQAGKVTPLVLTLDKIDIIEENGPNQYGSFLVFEGTYGGKKLQMRAEIEKKKKGYLIPKKLQFSLEIGSSVLNASLNKGWSQLTLENTVFSKNEKISTAQSYIFAKNGKYQTDNPLSCLFLNGDTSVCDMYLEK